MIILTDLSEVLVRGVQGVDELIADHHGQEVADQFSNRFNELQPFFIEMMRGHLTEREFWNLFFQEDIWPFGVRETKTLISMNFALGMCSAASVYERIVEYPSAFTYGVAHVVGRPEIWIVSDHVREWAQEIKVIHPEVLEMASKVIWSYDCGIVKSDKGFFHQLLYKHGLCPEEVIFIDDMIQNVWAATDAGIPSVEYDGPRQLERTMRAMGFRFRNNNLAHLSPGVI